VRKRLTSILAVLLISGVASACSSAGATSSATAAAPGSQAPVVNPSAAVTGSITVLTNRTDIVDSVFVAKYVPEFQKLYPNVQVKFEAIKNYDTDVPIRMNTTEYGDVLLIPNAIKPDQLASYFTPLGKIADLSKTYRRVTEQSFYDDVYGLPVVVNANGLVYNKKIWDAAGITSLPKTTDEFIADLKAIKAKNSATIPYYTNYKDAWPLTQWQSNVGEISGDANYTGSTVWKDDAPWAAGKDQAVIYKLLYDIVKEGLCERDPSTTDWESSKGLMGTGKVATMALGSWAISQMQQAAVDAGGAATDISYMPFPNQVGGKFVSNIGGDWKIAVNKHSKYQAASLAWLYWFETQSGFSYDQGGINPVLTGKNGAQYADFDKAGVTYLEQNPATPGNQAWLGQIQDKSKVQLYASDWVARIVDSARGASKETLDQIFADLNAKWKAARAALNVPSA
jgi:raffinose/stachyose/melibiose transport system substrate-binding protein